MEPSMISSKRRMRTSPAVLEYRYRTLDSEQVFDSEVRTWTLADGSVSKQRASKAPFSSIPLMPGESMVFAIPKISGNTDYKIGIPYFWNYADMPLIEKAIVKTGSKIAQLKGERYNYELPVIWCEKTVRWDASE